MGPAQLRIEQRKKEDEAATAREMAEAIRVIRDELRWWQIAKKHELGGYVQDYEREAHTFGEEAAELRWKRIYGVEGQDG